MPFENDIHQEKKIDEGLVHIIKFVLFSASAGIIQASSFALFEEVIHLTHWISYLLALVLSVLWNFTLNRKFTFKSAANIPLAMLKVACYYAVFTPISTYGMSYLTSIGWNPYVVLIINMVTNLVTEFIFTKYVVYRNQINTAVKK